MPQTNLKKYKCKALRNQRDKIDSPIVILADDLTGGLDSSCPFPLKGYKTKVYIDLPENIEPLKNDIDINPNQVVVFNTETRTSTEKEIEYIYDSIFLKYKWIFEKSLLFKKIDSTARGNIGFEIKLTLNKTNTPYAFVCLSYPELKRTQTMGILESNGDRIDHTKNNECLPPNLKYQTEKSLEIQSGLTTGLITQEEISKGEKYLYMKIKALISSETKIICLDSLTRQNLNTIYTTTKKHFPQGLLVGSGGLTKSLSESIESLSYKPKKIDLKRKSFALISLSSHPTTKTHFTKLAEHTQILRVSIDTDALLFSHSFDKEYTRIACIIENAILLQQNIAINQSNHPSLNKPNEIFLSKQLHIFLSKISAKLISYGYYKTLILIGGDTAHTVLQTASIKEIDVAGEILPGTVVSLPLIKNTKLKLITKSGGFGDEHHISNLISKLL